MPWETVTTKNGYSYKHWREPLPRIPDIILNSIVYLYRDEDEAETGAEAGGSGFLLVTPSRANLVSANARNAAHIYVVTNAHVVANGSPVVRVNLKHTSSGYRSTRSFPFRQEDWVRHPKHDLAVCAMPPDLDTTMLDIALLTLDRLITRQAVEDDRAVGPGDDLFYVGRFRDHAGKFSNQPSVRFGNISMLPDENEPIEYETTEGGQAKTRSQVGFLVEARSRGGYSGSPVFLYYLKDSPKHGIVMMDFLNFMVLGIDWGHLEEEVVLFDSQTRNRLPSAAKVHSGMMGVIPAWYLTEFIETSPVLIEQRRRDDAYYCNNPPTGAPDASVLDKPPQP